MGCTVLHTNGLIKYCAPYMSNQTLNISFLFHSLWFLIHFFFHLVFVFFFWRENWINYFRSSFATVRLYRWKSVFVFDLKMKRQRKWSKSIRSQTVRAEAWTNSRKNERRGRWNCETRNWFGSAFVDKTHQNIRYVRF